MAYGTANVPDATVVPKSVVLIDPTLDFVAFPAGKHLAVLDHNWHLADWDSTRTLFRVGSPSGQFVTPWATGAAQTWAPGTVDVLVPILNREEVSEISIDWGDGTSAVYTGTQIPSDGIFTHTWAEPGTYTVTVTVGSQTYSYTVVVLPSGPAPANNDFADAQVIDPAGESVTGRLDWSTAEAGEPQPFSDTHTDGVWYRYTPADPGTVTISTEGTGDWIVSRSDFEANVATHHDEYLAVFTGADLADLTLVAADEQNSNDWSAVTFTAEAGTDYWILVATTNQTVPLVDGWFAPWPFTLSVELTPTTPGVMDTTVLECRQWDFDGAYALYDWTALTAIPAAGYDWYIQFDVFIPVVTFNLSTSRLGAFYFTNAWGIFPNYDSAAGVWRMRTTYSTSMLPSDGTNVITPGQAFRVAIHYYPNGSTMQVDVKLNGVMVITGYNTTRAFNFNHFALQLGNNSPWEGDEYQFFDNVIVTTGDWPGEAGATVLLDTDWESGQGAWTFHDDFASDGHSVCQLYAWDGGPPPPVPPVNDDFANAVDLGSATSGSSSLYDTTVATRESGEPATIGRNTHSVWFKYTTPSAGTLTFDTEGSTLASGDTVLGVYTGLAVNALTLVASDDDSGTGALSLVSFACPSGTTYYIQVCPYDNPGGEVKVNWSLV